jgi:ketosteroid isomerase-like protein
MNGFDLPAVLTELLYGDEGDEPLERTLDRLLTPDFVQRINGRVYPWSEFVAHVRAMRQMAVGGGELRVLEQISVNAAIAGRYLFRVVSADGQILRFESHRFARVDGGRVARLVEVARQVADDDDGDFLATVQPA